MKFSQLHALALSLCLTLLIAVSLKYNFAEYPAYPTVMDINQIREILPHRLVFFTWNKQDFLCFAASNFGLCFFA
jgi:hypothetical protein